MVVSSLSGSGLWPYMGLTRFASDMMYNLSSRLTKSNPLIILRAIVASLDVWNLVRSMGTVTDGGEPKSMQENPTQSP